MDAIVTSLVPGKGAVVNVTLNNDGDDDGDVGKAAESLGDCIMSERQLAWLRGAGGAEGFIPMHELDHSFVYSVEEVLEPGQAVRVKCTGMGKKGGPQFSRKALIDMTPEQEERIRQYHERKAAFSGGSPRGKKGFNNGGGRNGNDGPSGNFRGGGKGRRNNNTKRGGGRGNYRS